MLFLITFLQKKTFLQIHDSIPITRVQGVGFPQTSKRLERPSLSASNIRRLARVGKLIFQNRKNRKLSGTHVMPRGNSRKWDTEEHKVEIVLSH